MLWITLDNLKKFWKGLRTNPITFTGEIDLQNTTRYKGNEIATKADISAVGSNITVDGVLSATSTNPVQNKVIKTELDKKAPLNAVPTKVSQLTNDSNYATNTELANGLTTASLTVSGETNVPTPATTNKSKTIANTEFVHGVVGDLVNGAPAALDTLQELATALGNDPNFSTTILNKIGEKESRADAQIEYERLQNAIPTKTSQLTNDANFAKTSDIPTKTSQLTNDSGFAVIRNGHLVINGSELWIG